MTVTSVRKLADIAEKIGAGGDPKKIIVAAIGQDVIDGFEPFLNRVLVATYARSDKTKGGIIIGGDRTRAEDRFQGRVGLVLKVGATAFIGAKPDSFGGVKIKEGDWVVYRPSDAQEFFFVDRRTGLDGASVRIIDDELVIGRVADPESIF